MSPNAEFAIAPDPSAVVAEIFVSDPESGTEPRFERFVVPKVKYMTVNDVLEYVTEQVGADIAYRRFCGVKKCGACAVRVNGKEVLACWAPAEAQMIIEPLRNIPLVRDLVVDREPYEFAVQETDPHIERREPYPGFPERLPHGDMANVTALDCLNCLACVSACPDMVEKDSTFAGPAVLVQLAQYALDPRDGADRRQTASDMGAGVACSGCGACEAVCPAKIPILTDVLEPLRRLADEA